MDYLLYCRFLSERETADRNFALGYYMKENRVGISILYLQSHKTGWSSW